MANCLLMGIFLFVLVAGIDFTTGSLFQRNIEFCKRNDPDLNDCLLKFVRVLHGIMVEGVPEFNLKPMDPLDMGETQLEPHPGLSWKGKNTVVKGLANATFEEFSVDFEKKKATVRVNLNLVMTSNFGIQGKVINIPLNGNGKVEMIASNIDMKVTGKFTLKKGNDGKDHLHIKNIKKDMVIGNCKFYISELFSPELDESMNNVFNNNWQEVIKELGGPAMDLLTKELKDSLNSALDVIPYDVILPQA